MRPLFVSPDARAVVERWYARFIAEVPGVLERRTVATKLGATHVLVGGAEGAPAVLLLHGAMASSAHLLRELAGLLERFRVYAVDVVGQSALSVDARPSPRDNTYGAWLVDVLDALQLRRANVVGVSWGGFCALRLAAVAPERIERLALLVPAGLVRGPAWAGFAQMGWPLLRYRLGPTPERCARLLTALLTTPHDALWSGYLADAFLSYDLAGMQVPMHAKPGEFAALRAPTLVVGAEHDLSFPGEALLARARVVLPTVIDTELLRGCRHSPPTTPAFRAWMSARIGAFLLGAERPPAAPPLR